MSAIDRELADLLAENEELKAKIARLTSRGIEDMQHEIQELRGALRKAIEHKLHVRRVEVSGNWTKSEPPDYYETIQVTAESDDPYPNTIRLAFTVGDTFVEDYPLYTELTVSIKKSERSG